jgi:nicotinamide riboside transporter PnuC
MWFWKRKEKKKLEEKSIKLFRKGSKTRSFLTVTLVDGTVFTTEIYFKAHEVIGNANSLGFIGNGPNFYPIKNVVKIEASYVGESFEEEVLVNESSLIRK